MHGHEPNALTPREREVLGFIRLGLTNEEIAERLGITLDGAKYHVSQILSKVGVATREEAAAAAAAKPRVRAPERRRWWAAWPLAAKAAGAAVVAASVAGLGVLAWGVITTSGEGQDSLGSASDSTESQPLRTPGPPTWTVEDARSFDDFTLYWLGEEIEGLPVTQITRYKFDDPVNPLSKEDSVSFIYGDCTPRLDEETGCSVPLSIRVEPRCSQAIRFTPGDFPGEDISVRGVPAKYHDEDHITIWTDDVTVSIQRSDTKIAPALALADALVLLNQPEPSPGEQLLAPHFSPCTQSGS